MGSSMTLDRNFAVLATIEAGGLATAGTFLAQLASLNERHRQGELSGQDLRAGRQVAVQRRLLTNRSQF